MTDMICPKCGAPDDVVACDDLKCPGTAVPRRSAAGKAIEGADKSWSSEQFWQFVEGLAGDFEAKQMRDELAERGLAIVPSSQLAADGSAKP